ncbi:MAG: CHAP domain-containing protein, partial [Candidatus Roizmanbacteria bacterium]
DLWGIYTIGVRSYDASGNVSISTKVLERIKPTPTPEPTKEPQYITSQEQTTQTVTTTRRVYVTSNQQVQGTQTQQTQSQSTQQSQNTNTSSKTGSSSGCQWNWNVFDSNNCVNQGAKAVWNAVTNTANQIVNAVGNAFNWAGQQLQSVGQWITQTFTQTVTNIVNVSKTVINNVVTTAQNVGSYINTNVIQPGIQIANDFMKGVIAGVQNTINGVFTLSETLLDTGKNIYQSSADWVTEQVKKGQDMIYQYALAQQKEREDKLNAGYIERCDNNGCKLISPEEQQQEAKVKADWENNIKIITGFMGSLGDLKGDALKSISDMYEKYKSEQEGKVKMNYKYTCTYNLVLVCGFLSDNEMIAQGYHKTTCDNKDQSTCPWETEAQKNTREATEKKEYDDKKKLGYKESCKDIFRTDCSLATDQQMKDQGYKRTDCGEKDVTSCKWETEAERDARLHPIPTPEPTRKIESTSQDPNVTPTPTSVLPHGTYDGNPGNVATEAAKLLMKISDASDTTCTFNPSSTTNAKVEIKVTDTDCNKRLKELWNDEIGTLALIQDKNNIPILDKNGNRQYKNVGYENHKYNYSRFVLEDPNDEIVPDAIQTIYKKSYNWNPDNYAQDYIECVTFVQMMYEVSGNPIPPLADGNPNGWSSATKKDKDGNTVKVFDTYTTGVSTELPKVGDAIIWPDSAGSGHVAVITNVVVDPTDKTKGEITIAQANMTEVEKEYTYVVNEKTKVITIEKNGWTPTYWLRLNN